MTGTMSSIRIFLLGALDEQGPTHGYRLRRFAERGHKREWTEFRTGSIYAALNRLIGEGLVMPVRTEREGARPERQIVQITATGRSELNRLRRQALTEFSVSPDPVDVTLTTLGIELISDLPDLLQARRTTIAAEIEHDSIRPEHTGEHFSSLEQHVLRHRTLRLRAELDWLDSMFADLPAIMTDAATRATARTSD